MNSKPGKFFVSQMTRFLPFSLPLPLLPQTYRNATESINIILSNSTIVWIFKHAGDEVRRYTKCCEENFFFNIIPHCLKPTLNRRFYKCCADRFQPAKRARERERERETERYSVTHPVYLQTALNSTKAILAGRWQKALKSKFNYLE